LLVVSVARLSYEPVVENFENWLYSKLWFRENRIVYIISVYNLNYMTTHYATSKINQFSDFISCLNFTFFTYVAYL